jgi:hypothetical protein
MLDDGKKIYHNFNGLYFITMIHLIINSFQDVTDSKIIAVNFPILVLPVKISNYRYA